MPTAVLTLVGADRVGLVNSLAQTVANHGGNWERSHFVELSGKFVGFVVVSVPDENRDALVEALEPLEGLLDIELSTTPMTEAVAEPGRELLFDLVGNDRPGLLSEVTDVLATHHLNISEIETDTSEAPMAGGLLFTARVVAVLPEGADEDAVQADLEQLAAEFQVDITLTQPG